LVDLEIPSPSSRPFCVSHIGCSAIRKIERAIVEG
jgi:hypothetical protein